MYLSFSIDVYVIFLYEKICIKYTYLIFGVLLNIFYAIFFGFIYNSFVFGFICNLFVISLHELLWSFSSDSSQYCCS